MQIQTRMRGQIQRLQENFEQAQLRVLGLQAQVGALRRAASSAASADGDPDADADADAGDTKPCACKSFFDEP